METTHTTEERLDLHGWAKTAILLGLGLYFVYTIYSGNLPNYINASFAWLSYVAAGLFLLLGTVSAYYLLRAEPAPPPVYYNVDTMRREVSGWALLLVSVPLVLGTVIPSDSLPVEAANGNINFSIANIGPSAAFSKAPLDRNVLDWLREFARTANPAAFNGQEADVIGFIYREPGFAEDQFMVARFTVSCCVADASAIGLPVISAGAAGLAEGAWVQVRGTFAAGDFRGQRTPILHAAQIAQVSQPQHPYLYP